MSGIPRTGKGCGTVPVLPAEYAGEAASRHGRYARGEPLEVVLEALNGALSGAQGQIAGCHGRPRRPLLLVMGAPRSGSTLLMQWLAASGLFGYPGNLMARFYACPYVGALVQRLATEAALDHQEELADVPAFDYRTPFRSDRGKSRGAASPSEFWYFWRRHFPVGQGRRLDAAEEAAVDAAAFQDEMAAMEAAFEKPLLFKAMLLNWNLPLLARLLPTAVFLHIRRDPAETACSVLSARRSIYGDERHWWSVRPPEYQFLEGLTPLEQAAGQVLSCHRAIGHAFESAITPGHCLEIAYERLCTAPAVVYGEIDTLLRRFGEPPAPDYRGPASFPVKAGQGERLEQARVACERLRSMPWCQGGPDDGGAPG